MSRWAIIDDHGIVEEGEEDDVKSVWDEMVGVLTRGNANFTWEGDILLVEIHGRHR